MSERTDSSKQFLSVKRYSFLAAVAWTAVIVLVFGWHFWAEYQNTLESARIQANHSFDKDLAYRRWASERGGL